MKCAPSLNDNLNWQCWKCHKVMKSVAEQRECNDDEGIKNFLKGFKR